MLGSNGKYETVKTVEGNSTTSAVITDLQSNTQYSFKIRSYKQIDSAKYYSAYSSVITAKTLNLPNSDKQAVESFVAAVNSTKSFAGACTAFETISTEFTVSPENSFTDVAASISENATGSYRFNGGETSKGKKLSELLNGTGTECLLSIEDIAEDSISYKENGSGFEVTFTLKQENQTAEINSKVTKAVDFDKVAKENEGFALDSCTYSGTVVNAKIQDGVISYISVDMPVEIAFAVDSSSGTFNGTVSRFFAFTYDV